MKKVILLIIGIIALILGTLGIFLPVLPTTPFILLSAGCFSVSSPRMARMLRKSKYFGSYIENYENKTGIPRKVKFKSILYLWVGLLISMWLIQKLVIILVLLGIGIGVTLHILALKQRI